MFLFVCLFLFWFVLFCFWTDQTHLLKVKSGADAEYYRAQKEAEANKVLVCLFVCLTGRSLRRHTWVLMGPDLNKMLKPGYKSLYKNAGQAVYENKEREKHRESRNEGKEGHCHSQQIKQNNFTVSLWDKRKEVLYPISSAKRLGKVHLTLRMNMTSWRTSSNRPMLWLPYLFQYPAHAPITTHQHHFQFQICGTINRPLKSSHPVASDYVPSLVLNTKNHQLTLC